MVKLLPYFFLLLICSPLVLTAQNTDITGHRDELQQLKSDIKELESQLKAKTKKEKQSLESLQIFTKQGLYLNKIINKIRTEESQKVTEIKNTRNKISDIEKEIKDLRDIYSKYVVYLYKYGHTDILNLFVNSRSLNQAYLRYRYLNRLTARSQNNLAKLEEAKKELTLLNDDLRAELSEKRKLEDQKRAEEKELDGKITERKALVKELKNNKSALKQEIELKRKSEIEIKNIIAKLVEEERRKAEERKKAEQLRKQKELALSEEKKQIKKIPPPIGEVKVDAAETVEEVDFSGSALVKGKLLWPINNAKIIRKFGENRNEKLNTVTLNYGVDIKAGKDLNVKAVSGGIVSSVTWLPGYGSIIILTHKDSYRTVYGHLGEIYAAEGTKVESGSIIGTVAEGLEGSILHFELWSERNNQNPELWLVKK